MWVDETEAGRRQHVRLSVQKDTDRSAHDENEAHAAAPQQIRLIFVQYAECYLMIVIKVQRHAAHILWPSGMLRVL